ncbi:MAG: rhodanese-like domain-containing protein [Ruminococcaceae bacterium]|nr:rhodanese-like domain-containing protein [Oscillospiraceae bacterium]
MMLGISLSIFGFCACGNKNSTEETTEYITSAVVSYEQISQDEAKRIMDMKEDFVIIDARTEKEFTEGHIEGAILIPEYEITERAEKEIPEKDTLILVYCRSGRRSKIAAEALVALGYTNVKEFGGIIDWQYEIVK